MFYGSDDHASAAGNVLSLVASCKLHDLDPEPYFCDIIKVLPYWRIRCTIPVFLTRERALMLG
jgi:hypothetical protein